MSRRAPGIDQRIAGLDALDRPHHDWDARRGTPPPHPSTRTVSPCAKRPSSSGTSSKQTARTRPVRSPSSSERNGAPVRARRRSLRSTAKVESTSRPATRSRIHVLDSTSGMGRVYRRPVRWGLRSAGDATGRGYRAALPGAALRSPIGADRRCDRAAVRRGRRGGAPRAGRALPFNMVHLILPARRARSAGCTTRSAPGGATAYWSWTTSPPTTGWRSATSAPDGTERRAAGSSASSASSRTRSTSCCATSACASSRSTGRLDLLRATRAHLSPIFGAYHDRGASGRARAARGPRPGADVRRHQRDGTRHRLWRCRDGPRRGGGGRWPPRPC